MAVLTPEQLAKPDTEHAHQVALFQWAAMNKQHAPELESLFAVPNGGERNQIVAARLVAEGTRSGVPDVCLPVARYAAILPGHSPSLCHSLYVEMKKPSVQLKRVTVDTHIWERGGVSTEQRKWLDRLTTQGNKCVVCYSWDEAARQIHSYLNSVL